MSGGAAPRLVLNMGAPPATPPPLPTRPTLVVTSTPTPANVLTVAANALTGTAVARGGTSAPSQFAVVTATPDQRVVITYTPVPQNGATATAQAAYATAVAVTTGTFTPMPRDAMTPIVVLPTPMPENVLTAAAQMVAAAAEIARNGTPTTAALQRCHRNGDANAICAGEYAAPPERGYGEGAGGLRHGRGDDDRHAHAAAALRGNTDLPAADAAAGLSG